MKGFCGLAMFVWFALGAPPPLPAQQNFRRGDVNGDGAVSISDVQWLELYLFQGGASPRCLKTADSNDDGAVDISDSVFVLNTLFRGGPRIPSPGQDPGPDPTDDNLECEDYGEGAPIEDAGASLEIVDATASGGEVGTARLQIRISSSSAIGGYSGRVATAENVFAGVGTPTDISGLPPVRNVMNFISADLDRGEIVFAYFHDIVAAVSMPPQDGVLVMEIEACLREGLAAGSYPLSLEEAELVDAETGRAILPQKVNGTLTVEADVTVQTGCESGSDPGGQNPPPPLPERPDEINASVQLSTEAVESGGAASVNLQVRSNAPVEGFTFSLDFDESRIQAIGATPSEPDWELFVFDIDNEDETPGSSGIAEGYIAGAAIFSRTSEAFFMAPDRTHTVMSIDFQVLPEAGNGASDIRFVDGGAVDGAPVSNGIRAFDQNLGPDEVNRLTLKDGALFIAPEGNTFVRGDVNLDGKGSISDAVMLRRFLFIGGSDLFCEDAADADDNGTINISDVVIILNDLFRQDLNELTIPEPHPARGPDPTVDLLTCDFYEIQPPAESDDLIRLGDIDVAPGADVSVPVLISSSVEVEAYQLVISYDPALFEPAASDVALDLEGTHYDGLLQGAAFFMSVRAIPEEGVILLGFVGSLIEEGFGVPPGEDVHVANIRGTVSESAAPDSEIALEFTNGPDGDGVGARRLRNELTHRGDARLVTVVPDVEGALLRVVGDITFFRGDANSDQEVNLSDAVFTLDYLFSGGEPPACPDAADANDDGRIEVSDPVAILNELFDGSLSGIAPPYPEKGLDPTGDDRLRPCLLSN